MAVNRESVVAAAEKYVARGKIESAIKEYRKLISSNPNDAMTLNRVGDLYVRIHRNEEAVRLFLQIAERYTEDGFFVKAIAIFKKIIKLDPTRLPIYEHLAELYHKQGLVTEARTQYQVLVDYYQKHGRIESAEGVLRKMAALDSGDPSPHVKLAEIYRERGENDKELAEYKQLAEMMLRHQRIEEATQVYAKAIAGSPGDLAFITDAVLGLKDAGHTAAAAKLLALAVERNPQAEKIARIAGLAKDRRTERSSSGVRRPPGTEDSSARVLKVSDIASVPPELRETPRRSDLTASEMRALPTPEEVEHAGAAEHEFTSSQVRDRFEIPPTSASASGPVPDLEDEVEFELEVEPFDESAPPQSAGKDWTAPAPTTPDIDWSFAPEPDLTLDLDLPAPTFPAKEPVEIGEEPDEAVSGETEAPSAGEPVTIPPERRLANLLAEAEVFRKYGLGEKAQDRVREILQEDPRHAGALALGVHLCLDVGKLERALPRAQQLHALVADGAVDEDFWAPVRSRLEKTGFRFAEGRPTSPPPAEKAEPDAVSRLLDELAGMAPKPRKAAPPEPRAQGAGADADLAALLDDIRSVAAPPPPTVPAARPPLGPDEVAPAEPLAPSFPDEPVEEVEDKLAWLDEAVPATGAPAGERAESPGDESLFDEEEGFFDLAAELEEELTKEEIETGQEMLPREEPSLEEIVEGFKKGVAESLSPEDFDTHFNLGIAYREMGLLDEAIGEFQLAAKHPNYLIDCCSLLGSSFLEKGLPELAVKWYQRGLATPDLSEDANLGLLYDLGNLYLATDDAERARRTFVELYGINSNYRDVVAKLEELRAL